LIALAQNTAFRPAKWLIAAAVPLTAFTVVSTFSRGGFLAMVAASVVWVSLQRRRFLIAAVVAVVIALVIAFVPLPQGYADRLKTIETYDEVQENSALSRLHVWTVAMNVAKERPLGIGLWGFESIYDRYDSSDGEFGRSRAIHNSHLQALVDTGWIGGVVWLVLLTLALWTGCVVFVRSRRMVENERYFFRTMSVAILTSMCGFVVGGSFVSLAYNDLTWLLFAALAALDRLSREAQLQTSSAEEALTIVDPVAAPV
jgi:O-antigen ligase